MYTMYTCLLITLIPHSLLPLFCFCLSLPLLYRHLSRTPIYLCCDPLNLNTTLCGAPGLEPSPVARWAWHWVQN